MEGVPPRTSEIGVPLVCGVGQVNFGCMAASDSLFDSRGRFSGSSYPLKTGGRLSGWELTR